jgi:hypothetical protein
MNEPIRNIGLLHTTEFGGERVKRNLEVTTDDIVINFLIALPHPYQSPLALWRGHNELRHYRCAR